MCRFRVDLQLSVAGIVLVRMYEDRMTKKLTGKEAEIKQNPNKAAARELQDDELQQVSGGLAASRPAVAADPVCISKLS
jgi:bacteriocin-like protein